eukprot:2125058-Rhodomonas_salina.1
MREGERKKGRALADGMPAGPTGMERERAREGGRNREGERGRELPEGRSSLRRGQSSGLCARSAR